MQGSSDTFAAGDPVRQAVLLGLFAGTSVGVGYLLSGIPNVELMTLVTATAGSVLGARLGFVCGVLAASVYSLANPYGLPMPILLVAQTFGLGTAGWLGALLGGPVRSAVGSRRFITAGSLAVLLGVLATFIYDLLTNVAFSLSADYDLRFGLIVGSSLAAVHLVSNGLLFAVLFPLLCTRAAALARSALRGGPARLVLCTLLAGYALSGDALAQEAPPESPPTVPEEDPAKEVPEADLPPLTTAEPETESPRAARAPVLGQYVRGWNRPLWEPFFATLTEHLAMHTDLLAIVDGGLGSAAVLQHEGGSSPLPELLRDGVPLMTGNRFTDDLWSYPIQGLEIGRISHGGDGWGGTDGVVDLSTIDPDPSMAVADTRWFKGDHETYLRGFTMLTPAAPWRFVFSFEEDLDNEGYDFTVTGDDRYEGVDNLGKAKFRSGRGYLHRMLSEDSGLITGFESVRKNKIGLPAYNLDNQDLWSQHVDLSWYDGTPAGKLRASFFWTERDVEWNRSDAGVAERKLEVAREGVRVELAGGETLRRRIWGSVRSWRLADTGTELGWALEDTGRIFGTGREGVLAGELDWRGGAVALRGGVAANHASYGGANLAAWLVGQADRPVPWWKLRLESGGRAPRSDELLTPFHFAVPERVIYLLPEAELEREKSWRGALTLQARWLGILFAADGSYRKLDRGIAWTAVPGQSHTGRWSNGLAMNSQVVTGRVEWGGKFLGWLRLGLNTTWRNFNITAGARPNLPPERSSRFRMLWENHFFHGDGIVQLAYFAQHRGEMSDAWSVDQVYPLPSYTLQSAMVGLRLVGTNLSLAIINLSDRPIQLSAGSMSPGLELHWRLHWIFHH